METTRRPYQNRGLIKYGAREVLKGRVLGAFAACLLPAVLSWALPLLPIDFGVVYILVGDVYLLGVSLPMACLSLVAGALATGPMGVSLAAFFLKLNRDPDNLPSPLTVCDCFGAGYWRLVRTSLLRDLRVYLWRAIPLAAGALMPGALEWAEVEGLSVLRVGMVMTPFVWAALLAGAYRTLRYLMTPYLLAEDPAVRPTQALRESLRLTRGRALELTLLYASFLGWILLVPVTFFLAAVYVYPYLDCTLAAYYLAFTRPGTPPEGEAGSLHAA